VPFVRVLRDKRGYETTYLMHWFREAQPPRSSILYVFRSPGHTGVGLGALEPDRQRAIEDAWPDIDFEWRALARNQQVVEVAAEPAWMRKRRRAKAVASESRPPAAPPAAPAPRPAQPAVPSAIEGDTREAQIAFLTEWYPRLRERVEKRTSDPQRLTAFLALAERLNPAVWTDADEIASGLPLAAEALERLSKVLARRRRSRRGGRKGPSPAAGAPAGPAPDADA
jgi:hypothetical protein